MLPFLMNPSSSPSPLAGKNNPLDGGIGLDSSDIDPVLRLSQNTVDPSILADLGLLNIRGQKTLKNPSLPPTTSKGEFSNVLLGLEGESGEKTDGAPIKMKPGKVGHQANPSLFIPAGTILPFQDTNSKTPESDNVLPFSNHTQAKLVPSPQVKGEIKSSLYTVAPNTGTKGVELLDPDGKLSLMKGQAPTPSKTPSEMQVKGPSKATANPLEGTELGQLLSLKQGNLHQLKMPQDGQQSVQQDQPLMDQLSAAGRPKEKAIHLVLSPRPEQMNDESVPRKAMNASIPKQDAFGVYQKNGAGATNTLLQAAAQEGGVGRRSSGNVSKANSTAAPSPAGTNPLQQPIMAKAADLALAAPTATLTLNAPASTQAPSELINQIRNYIIQASAKNGKDKELGVTFDHESLGRINVKVKENPNKELSINITAFDQEGKSFFQDNKSGLLNNLTQSGFKVSDFKLDAGMPLQMGPVAEGHAQEKGPLLTDSRSGSSSFDQQRQSEQEKARQDSLRRQEIWHDVLNQKG